MFYLGIPFSVRGFLFFNLCIKKNAFRETLKHLLEIDCFCLVDLVQTEGTRGSGRIAEMEQLVSCLNEKTNMKGGLVLWWQQLCAVAKLRFLKLKHERKSYFFL